MTPLLSIVVPTKNRYYFMKKLVLLIDSYKWGDDVELLIQDNTIINDEILEFLKKGNYLFVSYYHELKSLSQSGNSDLAVRNSKGEYVCFIGDDDGVTKDILECCKWMKEKGIECALPERIDYYWPDAHPNSKGALNTPIFTKEIHEHSSLSALQKLLKRGCVDRGNIPFLYQGIAKKETLDKIWNKCGTYFPGASPDIANGVSLCMVADKFVTISAPLIIGGVSKYAAGGINSLKYHAETDLSKVSQLPSNILDVWSNKIPIIWTNPTIWCESVVEALNVWGRQDLIEQIDFEKLYEYFVVFYKPYKNMAYKLTLNRRKLFFNCCILQLKHYWDSLDRRIRKYLHLKQKYITITGLKDINDVCKYYKSNGYNFQDIKG